MIKLFYPQFWQKRSLLAYLLLPLGFIYLLLGFLRKLIAEEVQFPAYTICVGNCTVGGTGKTQLIIELAQEFTKRNINFIILSKGFGGRCSAPALVTPSSSVEEVGDEALELCRYGNSFVVPKIKDALQIIAKYKPDVVLVDDGMQNPGFKKDMLIMTVDGSRGFGNGFPIPAGPMRSSFLSAVERVDIIVVNGGPKMQFDLDEPKPIFYAKMHSKHNFGNHRYYAFAGIGNPEKFFDLLKKSGANVECTKAFPDHHKYSRKDTEGLMHSSSKRGLKLITTRKDFVKINAPNSDKNDRLVPALEFIGIAPKEDRPEIPQVECFDVELKVENSQRFFELVLSKYKNK